MADRPVAERGPGRRVHFRDGRAHGCVMPVGTGVRCGGNERRGRLSAGVRSVERASLVEDGPAGRSAAVRVAHGVVQRGERVHRDRHRVGANFRHRDVPGDRTLGRNPVVVAAHSALSAQLHPGRLLWPVLSGGADVRGRWGLGHRRIRALSHRLVERGELADVYRAAQPKFSGNALAGVDCVSARSCVAVGARYCSNPGTTCGYSVVLGASTSHTRRRSSAN